MTETKMEKICEHQKAEGEFCGICNPSPAATKGVEDGMSDEQAVRKPKFSRMVEWAVQFEHKSGNKVSVRKSDQLEARAIYDKAHIGNNEVAVRLMRYEEVVVAERFNERGSKWNTCICNPDICKCDIGCCPCQDQPAVPVEERTQPPMRGNETKAVSDLLNSMKVIDRHQRYQECRSDVLTKLMYELAAFREKAWPVAKPVPEERTAEMEQWIEIKSGCEMPKEGQAVWAYNADDPGIFQASFVEAKFLGHRFGWGDYLATHWMPRFVPAPPETKADHIEGKAKAESQEGR